MTKKPLERLDQPPVAARFEIPGDGRRSGVRHDPIALAWFGAGAFLLLEKEDRSGGVRRCVSATKSGRQRLAPLCDGAHRAVGRAKIQTDRVQSV